jgi:SAM-dependent methyltransferase
MTSEENPKEIVRQGYDAISYAYRGDAEDPHCQAYHAWLDELLPRLSPGDAILELGCGCGVPVARRLAATYAYTGVDLSTVQIERARQLAPQAALLCADMTSLSFAPGAFGAVLAFYSIIHVPVVEQPGLLDDIAGWLRPGGLFMATLGETAWTGTEENWLDAGASMYWSHTGKETYLAWLAQSGLRVLWTRFIPEGGGGHVLVLAQKAAE